MAGPLYRGQGNNPWKTAQPQSAAKRGQTVPYDVNGKPSGPIAGALADGSYGDVTVSGTGTVFTVLQSAKLTTARTLAATGDVTWSGSFDGSANFSVTATLATVNASPGSYGSASQSLTAAVDAKGRITALSAQTIAAAWASITGKPTTLAGYGITDAQGLNANLTAIAGLTTAADKMIYWTGAGAAALITVTATNRTALSNLSGTNTGDQTITLTGDATGSGTGSFAVTVGKINGVSLAGLATGILKNTTTTGVPSIAVAGDFPTLNQSTTGSAASLTTGRTIAITGDLAYTSPSFDGTGNVTAAGTLATVNSNVGSFGSATQTGTFTVNAKGLTTAASNVTITPAVGSITGLGTGVATALAVNVGSAGALVTFNGALGTPSSGTLTNCTFPTLNQNTTGSAATLTTSRNIDGQAFNGSADITVIAPGTHAATSKTTPVDADELPLVDSAASNLLKKLTWANLKATLKTYLDTLYQALNSNLTTIAGLTATTDNFIVSVSSAWASRTPAQVRSTLGFGSGGYTTGTSFPGSPSTNDLCYRSDRAIEYYYDGTRWLSTQIHFVPIPNTDFLLPRTATTLGMCRAANPWAALYAIYVVDAVFHNFITATSTWTLAIIDNDASVATTLATRSTSGDAINTHLSNRVSVNAVVASTVDNLQGEATLVSGTASLYCSFGLTYRLIG